MRPDRERGQDPVPARRVRFVGEITGIGTTSGHRFVIGDWPESPFGPVADVMVESPDGVRTLLAPSDELAGFVASTYAFDEVRVGPVEIRRTAAGRVLRAGPLAAELGIGRRDVLGWLLRAVPRRIGASPAWTALTDPVARVGVRGVRTRGSAGAGRREFYGAHDRHRVVAVEARWDGRDLGVLAPVDPPVRFGFGSVPSRPSVVAITTTIELPA
jgi:hypothetical protein